MEDKSNMLVLKQRQLAKKHSEDNVYGSFIKVKQSQLSAFKVEIECFLLKFEPIVRIDVHLGTVLGSRVMKQH